MTEWMSLVVTVLTSVIASSGAWGILMKYLDKRDTKKQMLKGLGHTEIIRLCNYYEERGWITDEEYDDIYSYLYLPYVELGGNGSAERAMNRIKGLPRRDK